MTQNIDDLRRSWAGGSGNIDDLLRAKFGGAGNLDDLRRAYFGGSAGQNIDDVLHAAYGAGNLDDQAQSYYGLLHRSTFTAPDGTALASYTPEVGGAWAATSGTYAIQAGRVVPTGAATNIALADAGAADLDVRATVTLGASGGIGLLVRASDASNFWMAWLDLASKQVRLYENAAGTLASRQTDAISTLTAGGTYALRVRTYGARIVVTVDDGHMLQYDTATSNQAATKIGLRTINNAAFTVDDLTALAYAPTIPALPTIAGATNQASYLALPSYDGQGQGTHPDVIDFGAATPWQGYRYWMAYTPHTGSNSAYENPQIVASNDGTTWVVPPGLVNPIEPYPGAGNGYNSDPDLVYANGLLHCFFRYTDGANSADALYLRTSADGVTWSAKQTVLSGPFTTLVAPSFVYDGATWTMWVIDVTRPGNYRLVRYTASSPTGPWSAGQQCIMPIPSGQDVWHCNIVRAANGALHGVFAAGTKSTSAAAGKLYFAISYDGLLWNVAAAPFLSPGATGAWDASKLYRSTISPVAGGYDLWYAGQDAGNNWHIARTSFTVS